MKKYIVTLALVTGYSATDYDQPILKHVEFAVEATNETEAIRVAKNLDKSYCSVYESWASEA